MFNSRQEPTQEELEKMYQEEAVENGQEEFEYLDARSHIAVRLMAGLLANPEFYGPSMQGCVAAAAETSIKAAESLLYNLRKTE